jgi:murein L,D-transpeptidase YafK
MKKSAVIIISFVAVVLLLVHSMYPGVPLPANMNIDRIEVLKSQRKMSVYSNGVLVRTYKIALGKQPTGAKQQVGDNKTPEGVYTINTKTTESRYHKNLGISYPNETDKNNARMSGAPTGGDIKIHGLQNGLGFIGRLHTVADWTAGCIALTNSEIDDLYEHVSIGISVEIKP